MSMAPYMYRVAASAIGHPRSGGAQVAIARGLRAAPRDGWEPGVAGRPRSHSQKATGSCARRLEALPTLIRFLQRLAPTSTRTISHDAEQQRDPCRRLKGPLRRKTQKRDCRADQQEHHIPKIDVADRVVARRHGRWCASTWARAFAEIE